MHRSRVIQLLLFVLMIGLLLGAGRLLDRTVELRETHNLTVNEIREGVPPQVVLATTALGGFRSIFIDLLWIKAIAEKENGNFYEMIQLYDWITTLQPHYTHVFRFIGWDLSYNVSVEINNLPDRWFWVYRGIRYLRDKGIPYNPYDEELYHDLAWIYYHKVGASLDFAARYYRQELARLMHATLGGPAEAEFLQALIDLPETREELADLPAVKTAQDLLAPEGLDLFENLNEIASPGPPLAPETQELLAREEIRRAAGLVHLLRVRDRLRSQFKLEPEKMLALNRTYGPLDWRVCFAHSLYWAEEGKRAARVTNPEGAVDMRFERLIYFSLSRLAEQGRIFLTPEGTAYSVPDFRFIEPARKAMKALVERSEGAISHTGRAVNITGALSGYTNFLKNSILTLYFNQQLEQAGRYLEELRKLYPDQPRYAVALDVFIRQEMDEFIYAMSMDRFAALLEARLRQQYYYLALGDGRNASQEEAMVRFLHEYGSRRWRQQGQDIFAGAVPPLREMRLNVLARILNEEAFGPTLTGRLVRVLPEELVAEARELIAEQQRLLEESESAPGDGQPDQPAP